MSESKICKFCHKSIDWEELYEHMIINHREEVLKIFGTQINDFLDDVIYENFAELIIVSNQDQET